VAASLGHWLSPGFEGAFDFVPKLDEIEALSEDRAKLWKRVGELDAIGGSTRTGRGPCASAWTGLPSAGGAESAWTTVRARD